MGPQAFWKFELDCEKKIHLSNGKVLIMAEASSLAKLFFHRNVTYKLLKQNCRTNICGNACAQSVSGRNKCVCSSSHALCYRCLRSCEIHNSFASYDGTSFVLVALAGLIVSEPKHWVTWSRRTGDKIEFSILVFLLNKIIFNSFLLVV